MCVCALKRYVHTFMHICQTVTISKKIDQYDSTKSSVQLWRKQVPAHIPRPPYLAAGQPRRPAARFGASSNQCGTVGIIWDFYLGF